ncbi:MAG TPA: Ig-like domain-containing protein [Edaphocola sp.]|nr:Ig-like domain-containing protein [Edaphocola sp.]
MKENLFKFKTRSFFRKLALCMSMVFFLGLYTANAAITYSTSAVSSTVYTSSKSVTYNSPSGSNQLMVVSVVVNSSSVNVTGASFGAASLTQKSVITNSSGVRIYVFYLANPTAGSQSVTVNFSGSTRSIVMATTFSGVDYNNPFGSDASINSWKGNVSLTVPSTVTGQLVYLLAGFNSNGNFTHGNGQVELTNNKQISISGVTSVKPAAVSNTAVNTNFSGSGYKVGYAFALREMPACNLGNVAFALGATSSRCQGAGSVTYSATAANAATIVYTLDAASLAAGNTINATTGTVNYDAGWSGTSTITATASAYGCTDKTATHTVTVTPTVETPVFVLGTNSQRCSAAGTITYTAIATNNTGLTYSLDAASITGGNSINTNTGAVTYAATWSGTSVITATATGCSGPVSATHTVTVDRLIANNDTVQALQGVPVTFNVLGNDLCDINSASVTVVTPPSMGTLQNNGNGSFTYLPIGNFSGNISFTYQVCSNAPVICKQATVILDIAINNQDACAIANKSKVYYMPFPENTTQLQQSLKSAASQDGTGNDARNITSIVVPYPGTVIIYDHWEDGYEANIKEPTQSTTRIWGDGDLSNGVAPGYANDIIPAGAYIELDNTFPWNRTNSVLTFDGKDKVYSSFNVSITKVTGGQSNFGLQNVKTNIADVSKYGQLFVLPFGEDVNRGSNTAVFRYTGLFVNAAEDGTIVELDLNADGTTDFTSPTLNEGEVWFYNGTGSTPGNSSNDVNKSNDIKSGAIVKSNKDVGVNLVFGGIDNYGTRNIPVFPSQYYGSEYITPVYSKNSNAPAYAYFVNPGSSAITITWTRSAGSPTTGTITVPAKGTNWFNLDETSGTKFKSNGDQPFTAVVVVDDDNTASTYDWAYNMTPMAALTDFGILGWAPGSSANPPTTNTNPVWVTATTATTVYVKYNGNITSGGTQSPCGAYYDASFSLTALQGLKIKDPDHNNSGMAVFTCDGTPISIVWGQEPESGTPTGAPALDVGYRVEALCKEKMMMAGEDRRVTTQNTPINIDVQQNDFGFLVVKDPASISTTGLLQPQNGSIVVNPDYTITYSPNVGFIGIDTFEYRICAQAPDDNVCATTTVYVRVNCSDDTQTESIKGTVFSDVNIDATPDAGEEGIATIPVQLYKDNNNNGVYNAGVDVLIATQNTDNLGNFKFDITQNNTIRDEFSTNGSGTGNNGTVNWSGNWAEINESNGFNSGSIIVMGNKLRIAGNGAASQAGARRTANLTGAIKAVLTYDFNKNAFSSLTNDWVEVQISNAVNGPYTTIARYDGQDAYGATDVSFDITSYMSANTIIRFLESSDAGFASSEYVEFDNVQIKYYTDENFILKLDDNIPNYNITNPTSPSYFASSYSNVLGGMCSHLFGLGRADLAVNKTVNKDTAYVGQQIQFTITVTNNGPTATENVVVTDVLPTGLSYVSHTATAGVYTSGNGNWEISRLDNAEIQTLEITALVTITGPLTNIATITGSSQPDSDNTNNEDDAIVVGVKNTTNAINDENSTWINTPVSGDVTTNDFDLEGNTQAFGSFLNQDGSGNVITSGATVKGTDANGNAVNNAGTLTFNNDGTYTYTPALDFVGNISVPYNICDNGTPSVCDTAYLDITVSPIPTDVNGNSVIANNDEYFTLGSPVSANITVNDADPQGDNFTVTSYKYDSDGDGTLDATGSVGTSHTIGGYDEEGNWVANAGTLQQNSDGAFTFTPTGTFKGTVSYDYTITDNGIPVATDNATVVITVLRDQNGSKNDPPIAGDDFSYTKVNTPVDGNFKNNDSDLNNDPISIKDVNGNPVMIDPNGPKTSVVTKTTEQGGTVEFFSDGTYKYTPPTDYVGEDNVVYEICDVTTVQPQPLCAQATIHMLTSGVMISGNVYHDADGVTDNNISETGGVANTGTNVNTSTPIYANLTDASGVVLQSVPVQNDGTYRFGNVAGGAFKVVLTESEQTKGSNLMASSIPTGWISTGENQANGDNDNHGTIDGVNEFTVTDEDVNNINFGIEQTPTADLKQYLNTPKSAFSQVNNPPSTYPIEAGYRTIKMSSTNLDGGYANKGSLSGSDPEDCAVAGSCNTTGNNKTFRIETINSNTKVYYDFNDGNGPVEITTPTSIPNFDYDKLVIYAQEGSGNGQGTNPYGFTYSLVDAAGIVSTPANYHIYTTGALPISLLNFDATKQNRQSLLTWITTLENNNKGFQVERSKDAKNWSALGFVNSKADNGNSQEVLNYDFTDVKPHQGVNYYRLKQMDFDGQSTFSEVRSLVFNDLTAIRIYPNPANEELTVEGVHEGQTLIIYNVLGQEMQRKTVTSNGINTLNVASLSAGQYQLVIVNKEMVIQNFKFVKH